MASCYQSGNLTLLQDADASVEQKCVIMCTRMNIGPRGNHLRHSPHSLGTKDCQSKLEAYLLVSQAGKRKPFALAISKPHSWPVPPIEKRRVEEIFVSRKPGKLCSCAGKPQCEATGEASECGMADKERGYGCHSRAPKQD